MSISIANLDSGGDSPRAARVEILAAVVALNDLIDRSSHLTKYGALASNGTSDDAATFQAAAASGVRVIDARGVNCRIGSQIDIPNNQIWLLEGANLNIVSSTLTVFNCVFVNDFALLGPFTITGGGSTAGTACGVRIEDCGNWYVDRPIFKLIEGYGMYRAPGASATLRSQHGTVNNLRADACWIGYNDDAGTGAEYSTLINPHITRCDAIGLITAAGNVLVHGGHIVDNATGVVVTNGANHAHGGFFGVNINHNSAFNLKTELVLNGETFTGCHFYAADGAGGGAIFLDRSAGIQISGGHLDCVIYNYSDGTSGLNVIENMYCPGGYGICRKPGVNDGHEQLVIRGCYGPGVYAVAGGNDVTGVTVNDPSNCYAYAERQAGVTQSLTTGVSTVMLWPYELLNRRNAFDTATGVFTVPSTPSQAGMYSVQFDAMFSGATISPTSSYVMLTLNGAARKFFFGCPFGAKLTVGGVFDIYLSAGDALAFEASMSGTTLIFGDATVASSLSISRIA